MSPPAFDEILHLPTRANVGFVIVGGLALGAQGVIRATKDIDIVPDPDLSNLQKIAETASRLGGYVQKGDQLLGTPASITALLASGEQVSIETKLGRLDIVQGLPGVPSFRELNQRATEATLLGSTVRICSLDDLKAMKKTAGRPRDLVDLEDLESLSN